MTMSRRKQLHPKSLKDKEDNAIRFVLPDELKYDEIVGHNCLYLFIIYLNL